MTLLDTNKSPTMANPLIEQFKDLYRDMMLADLSQLDQLYAQDVTFQDPVHHVKGCVALQDYMSALCEDLTQCQFEYLDELVGEQSAYIKWVMHFRHPRLGNKLIHVRGTSHVTFDHKIHFHEDLYDMGAMLYEHLPIMGATTRWLKRRLQS